MSWDEIIRGWETALDEIESALAAGDWRSLEAVPWPDLDDETAAPSFEQRRRVRELSERQQAAAAAINSMLEDVGRELRDAATQRGALHAYEAGGRTGS